MAKFIIFGFVSPKLSRCESSSDVRHTAKAIGPPTHLSVHIMTPTIIHVLSIITKSTPIIFLPNWKIEIWFLAPLRRAIAFVPFHCTVWPRWEIEDSQTFHIGLHRAGLTRPGNPGFGRIFPTGNPDYFRRKPRFLIRLFRNTTPDFQQNKLKLNRN